MNKWDFDEKNICKLIPNKFAYKKDILCRFRSLVNRIFVEKMRDNYVYLKILWFLINLSIRKIPSIYLNYQ